MATSPEVSESSEQPTYTEEEHQRELQLHVARATAAVQSAKDRHIARLERILRSRESGWLPDPSIAPSRDEIAHRLLEDAGVGSWV